MKPLASRATALLAGLGLAAAAPAQDRTFTAQYSFGDSLSDVGNVFALTRTPPAPYANGRFSNGPVWVELLGQTLVPSATVSSAGPNRGFAFGGATAGGGGEVPSLPQQIASYRAVGQPARSTDLFTVLAGNIDLLGTLTSPATAANPANLDVAGRATAQAVATNVQALIGLGAKNIVVAGVPNLGATPRALASGGPGGTGAAFGQRASAAFNTELRSRLGAMAAAAPDVNLIYVDLQGLLDRLAVDYRALGFANTTSYVLAPAAQGGGGNPADYVFFDEIHPTARTHALLAGMVLEQLNPERALGFAATQGTAALALTGLGAAAVEARAAQLTLSNRPAGRIDVYSSFDYTDGGRGDAGRRERFGFDGFAATAGADGRLGADAFAGLAVHGGRLDVAARRGGYRVTDGSGRIYGVWRAGATSLLLDAAYGTLRVQDIRRATAFGGLEAAGKTAGTHRGAGIRVQWSTEAGPASVRPWAGVRTSRVKLDGYAERDVPALTMEFAEQAAKSSRVAAGVDVSLLSQLGPRQARLDFRLAWHGEAGSRTREVAGRLADNFTRPTAVAVEDGDGDGVEVGGAATVFLGRNWGASAGYTADVRSGERVAHRGTVALQTGF